MNTEHRVERNTDTCRVQPRSATVQRYGIAHRARRTRFQFASGADVVELPCKLRPGVYAELSEDRRDLIPHGVHRRGTSSRDLRVGFLIHQPHDDLAFTLGERRGKLGYEGVGKDDDLSIGMPTVSVRITHSGPKSVVAAHFMPNLPSVRRSPNGEFGDVLPLAVPLTSCIVDLCRFRGLLQATRTVEP